MKLRLKLALFAISTGVAFQFGANSCARFLGDFLGDTIWLRGID